MADIIALAGLNVSTTVNGVIVRLTRGRIRIGTQVLQFATTGQTRDADLKAWMNTMAGGANNWEVEADGYIDHNIVPAARLIGDAIKFRPGTTPPGVFQVLFATGDGFAGSLIIDQFEGSWDAEGNKPITVRVSGKGDGILTYINT